MQSKAAPLLPQLEEIWREKGWSLASLRSYRMEGDGGGAGGASGSGSGAGDGAQGGNGGAGQQGGGNGGSQGNAGQQDGQHQHEHGYPPNTPIAEMTDKEQAAYWKHQSRKHEARAGERADYDEIKRKADEYDELAAASKSENERAVEAAKKEGADAARAEERAKAAMQLVDLKMEAVAAARGIKSEQLAPVLEPIDRTKFLTDSGDVDADKVTQFIAALSPAEEEGGNGNKGRGHVPNLGQGRRSEGQGAKPTGSVSAGADRYADRHKKPTSQAAS